MNSTRQRQAGWERLRESVFDVAIAGGGVNGACLYHHLRRDGYRVLLLDKGDFAGGTSQASAMMVWGGLLYLRNGDLLTVRRLCAAREDMIACLGGSVRPQQFRYLCARNGGCPPALVHAALQFYWLLGACRRRRPRRESSYAESAFLSPARFGVSWAYEEAWLESSDARFVLHWILPAPEASRTSIALNHCALAGGGYEASTGQWRLELRDALGPVCTTARARWVVNAGGVWTDGINSAFGIQSPYVHVLSKGVFLTVKRPPEHHMPLIFETGDGDHRCFSPWGPVSLYGPTETIARDLAEGFAPRREDVSLLLEEMNQCLAKRIGPEDIIALRCGVRPVAVERGRENGAVSQHLSRKHRICRDPHLPWLSLYGSNMSNCVTFAGAVRERLRAVLKPGGAPPRPTPETPAIPHETFPGLPEEVPSARWCAENEMCCTLEDYLRRRTNIAQWVARGGLGHNDENLPHLARLARILAPGDPCTALAAYRDKAAREFGCALPRPQAVPSPVNEAAHAHNDETRRSHSTAVGPA